MISILSGQQQFVVYMERTGKVGSSIICLFFVVLISALLVRVYLYNFLEYLGQIDQNVLLESLS